jgi:hypothetical protein
MALWVFFSSHERDLSLPLEALHPTSQEDTTPIVLPRVLGWPPYLGWARCNRNREEACANLGILIAPPHSGMRHIEGSAQITRLVTSGSNLLHDAYSFVCQYPRLLHPFAQFYP